MGYLQDTMFPEINKISFQLLKTEKKISQQRATLFELKLNSFALNVIPDQKRVQL